MSAQVDDTTIALGRELDAMRPGAEWPIVVALTWRVTDEGYCPPCGIHVMLDRGWLEEHPDGPIPLEDGRRVQVTDVGRTVATEILP